MLIITTVQVSFIRTCLSEEQLLPDYNFPKMILFQDKWLFKINGRIKMHNF